MSFTFPQDAASKSGAVRPKNAGSEFVVPVMNDAYDVMEIKRATLTANTNTALAFSGTMDAIEVQNIGPGDVFARLDAAAAVDGATSLLIPEGSGYVFPIKGITVNVIASGTPKVQAVGVKNNA